MATVEFHFEVSCAVCKADLKFHDNYNGDISVEPCEKCIKREKEDAEKAAHDDGHNEGYEEGFEAGQKAREATDTKEG